jgi:hypothetical protein
MRGCLSKTCLLPADPDIQREILVDSDGKIINWDKERVWQISLSGLANQLVIDTEIAEYL